MNRIKIFIALTNLLLVINVGVASETYTIPTQQQLNNAYLLKYATNTGNALSTIDELIGKHPRSYELWEIKAALHMFNAAEVNIFRKRGQIKSAIAAMETATEINPMSTQSQALLYALYEGLPGFLGGGEDKFIAKSNEIVSISSALYFYSQGLRCVIDSNDECAIERFFHALDQDFPDADIYIAVIRYLIEQEALAKASEYLAEALLLYAEYPPLEYQYARYQVLHGEVTGDVVETLYRLIANYAESPPQLIPEYSFLMLARAHQRIGNFEESREYYKRVINSAPLLIERTGFEEYSQQALSLM